MKCSDRRFQKCRIPSPSIRREWIEIRQVWICGRDYTSLPPYGGSGLKSVFGVLVSVLVSSPSMRREWIEIFLLPPTGAPGDVSLHAEGVD